MTFSDRTDWDLTEDDLAVAIRTARLAGAPLVDLTTSNPTACGFNYGPGSLLTPLADPSAQSYEPLPLGALRARTAVAKYYADHGAVLSPENVCLTTSTSEAYSFLFRLLCNPGDDILVASPSYPLFDYIARLHDVSLHLYPLHYDPNAAPTDTSQAWSMDLSALAQPITPRTRAIVVVHPNNPTGNFVSPSERLQLQTLCAERGLALIVDEVFLDYPLTTAPPQTFAHSDAPCLTFVLSGISKVCALPQMKVSWLAATGPANILAEAMARVEVIADTFLSLSAPAQFALPHWLAHRHNIQNQILARMRTNLATLDTRLPGTLAQRLSLQGGWTAVLRVPRTASGRPFVYAALEAGVLVQPGDFYGLSEGHVVLSLLTPPDLWHSGLGRLPI